MTQTRRALAATLLALPLMAQAPQAPTIPTQTPPPTSAQTPRPRLANPSAEFCVQRLGGSFEIERATAGERGICVLRDGRRMDAWALYRAYHRDAPAGGSGDEDLPPGGPHLME